MKVSSCVGRLMHITHSGNIETRNLIILEIQMLKNLKCIKWLQGHESQSNSISSNQIKNKLYEVMKNNTFHKNFVKTLRSPLFSQIYFQQKPFYTADIYFNSSF